MNRRTTISLLVAATGLGGLPLAVTAQDDGSGPLEEVVVTATRREASLQDVPIAVTAISEDALFRSGIADVTRLDAVTPGLSFGQSGSDARPAIRGARTESTNERQDPVIGFFVDGVYQARTSQALASFYDVQRVEVLRGPQGTLFGRNTFGGAISVTTRTPDLDGIDYRISAQVASFGHTKVDGFFNVPLSDTVGLRIAGMTEQSDGFINNLIGEDWGQQDNDAVRVSLSFEPTDTFSGLVRLYGWQQGGLGGGDFGYTVLGTLRDPLTGTTDLNGVFDPNNPRNGSGGEPADPGPYDIFRNTPSLRDTEAFGVDLNLEWDLGAMTLKSITSSQQFETFRQNDSDFSSGNGSFSSVDTDTETITQEFQLYSNDSSSGLDWIVGAYFIEDETEEIFLFEGLCASSDVDMDPTTATVCTGPASPTIDFAARGVVDTSGYAVFGEATYEVSDTFSVTAGLRYTEDDKDFDRFDQDRFINTGEIVQIVDESETFDEVTYKLGAQWIVGDDSLIYAHYSTGFNSGGFNTAGAELSFDEQTVDAFELGSKNVFADGQLVLNAALYYNSYDDLLSQGFIQTGPTVSVFSTNAGEADILGLEAEIEWEPYDDLVFTAALNFTDSELGDYIVGNPFVLGGQTINGVNNLLQLEGSEIALTPDFTAAITARQRIDLGEFGSLTPFIQVSLSSDYQTNDVRYEGGVQDDYALVDLRLSWLSESERWGIEGFVNNVSDEAVLNRTVVGGQDAIFANYNMPRYGGLRVNYQFR
ncbi:MAG: TonB-dependent receptor [Pseudomonadota bacterium]